MATTYPSTQQILSELGVEAGLGLTTTEVDERRKKYGSNVVELPPAEPWWKSLLEKFTENPIPILIGAAIISIILAVFQGHFPVDGIAILVAVMLAVGVGFVNEFKSGIEYEKLKLSRLDVPVTVTRDGREHKMPISEIVVGDIVHLETGSKIPADAVLIHSESMEVDQSRITGESSPAEKGETDTRLFGGTDVVVGTGIAIVTKVGNDSDWGKIARQLVSEEQEKTPLEERLDKLTEVINKVGTWAAILIFLALVAELLVRAFVLKEPLTTDAGSQFILGLNAATFDQFVRFLIIAITIVVVAVPEGLPMAVNLSLAYSMGKITADKNLVRKMAATETIGSANVICSDKTGTLTQNKMTVAHLYLIGQRITGQGLAQLKGHRLSELLHLSAAVNSTAHLILDAAGNTKPEGNSTEGALLTWVTVNGAKYKELREESVMMRRIPFNAEIKRMTSYVEHNGNSYILTKGAPERVLELCANIECASGPEPIGQHLSELQAELSHMTGQAMRTLALAYRNVPDGSVPGANLESNMTLLALIGIVDPMRLDVPDAIRIAREAGIDIKMVTGDNPDTARVLAKELGLLSDSSLVLEADDFNALKDEDVIGILPRLSVLARARPADKLRLVNLLQSLRLVVAVTGDGTNDALALKKADVGLSMGLSGTEVAKEASDIVLLDDNFRSIVRAVHWGRALYENIQKFIQFQLTINVSALLIAFLSPLLNLVLTPLFGIRLLEVPLTVTQLLWVNLIMDTLAVLALVTEPPSPDIMKRPPIGRTEPFITRTMWQNIIGMGLYFTVVLLLLQATNFLGADKTDPRQFSAMIFTTYVFFQIFNEFNCRSLGPNRSGLAGIRNSRNFLAVILFIVVVQVALTQFGGVVFNTTPLPLDLWVRILLLTSSAFIIVEGLKLFRRQRSITQPAT